MRPRFYRYGFLAFILIVWQLVGPLVNPIFFSYPSKIALAFYELTFVTGELQHYMVESLAGPVLRARHRHRGRRSAGDFDGALPARRLGARSAGQRDVRDADGGAGAAAGAVVRDLHGSQGDRRSSCSACSRS